MKRCIKFHFVVAMVCVLSSAGFAGVLLSPVSATASLPTETTYPNCTPERMVDQSGLVTPFVSGVTEYASYMAGDPRHESLFQDGAYLSENDRFGQGVLLTFDLGESYIIEHVVIWNGALNKADGKEGIKGATIYFSEFWDFSVFESLGVDVPQVTDPTVPFSAYVINLRAPPTARYIRIDVATNHGNPGHYSVSEVAFGVVPEPMTAVLLGFGAIGLLKRGRR